MRREGDEEEADKELELQLEGAGPEEALMASEGPEDLDEVVDEETEEEESTSEEAPEDDEVQISIDEEEMPEEKEDSAEEREADGGADLRVGRPEVQPAADDQPQADLPGQLAAGDQASRILADIFQVVIKQADETHPYQRQEGHEDVGLFQAGK